LLTGASASVKGYPQSAVFAMGKFALRGLAQSMARELAPKGIHVAHFVIDGGVRNAEKGRIEGGNVTADSYLDPDAIAAAPQRLDVGGGVAAVGRTVLTSLLGRHGRTNRN
jgi:short-subunit dehydrogenase